jgi:hypothetical protein
MLEPPRVMPRQVLDEVAAMDVVEARRLNKMAVFASLAYFMFLPRCAGSARATAGTWSESAA